MVNENKKTIQITPELFRLSAAPKATRNKTRKNPPKSKKNPLKQALMNKIKEHAKKNNKTLKHQHDDTISSEIDSHMDYLMNLEKKQKIKINTKLPKELEGPVETRTPPSSTANIITVKAGASKNISSAVHRQSGGETPNTDPPPNTSATKQHPHPPPPPQTPQPMPPPLPASNPSPSSVGSKTTKPNILDPEDDVGADNSPTESVVTEVRSETVVAPPPPTEGERSRIAPEPAFGILKGGKKPTYRQWYNKTCRRKPQISMPKERIQQVKRSYNLGKSNKTRKVSILLKNKEKRREIQDEINSIKREKVVDIKKYLRNHNIIKSGSTAPHDVLRQLYQQSRLAGGINNKSNENVIHNYLAEGDEDA